MEDTLKMSRYKLLKDSDWLKSKYEEEKLSCKEIGDLIGCSKDGVRVALLRHNIPLRTATQTNKIILDKSGGKSQKYPQLNDYDWLHQKYHIEGLSTKKIRDLVGAKTSNSVSQALKRKNIPIREKTISTVKLVKFYKNVKFYEDIIAKYENFILATDVIVGSLLGDASLRVYNKKSDFSYPVFLKTNKNYDHVCYVAGLIFRDGGLNRIKERFQLCNGKNCRSFLISSFANEDLLQMLRDWYPASNNYKKLVPRNIEINKTVLLHWFMDDGCASYRKREGKYTKQVVLVLCSQSFSKEDQEWLCNRINEKTSLGAKVIKCQDGTGWLIRVPQSQVQQFYKFIGPCPVPSLAYKWKTLKNENPR